MNRLVYIVRGVGLYCLKVEASLKRKARDGVDHLRTLKKKSNCY